MTTGLLVSQMPFLHISAAIKISPVKVCRLVNMWKTTKSQRDFQEIIYKEQILEGIFETGETKTLI